MMGDARNAGILGVLAAQGGSGFLSEGGFAFGSGTEDGDLWSSMTGTGLAYGDSLGLLGSGRQGGGGAEGLAGMGQVGLVSKETTQVGLMGFGPKKEKKPPMATLGKVESSGLDRDVVRRIVRAHINEIRSCYNQALVKNPTLEGRVLVQFTVLNTGKVSGVVIQEDTTKAVGPCVQKAVKRWTFPASKGMSIVSYPFKLSQG